MYSPRTARLPSSRGADHGEHVDQRQLAAELLLGIVQDAAERRIGPAHHAFHAVGRADEVAFVDALPPPVPMKTFLL